MSEEEVTCLLHGHIGEPCGEKECQWYGEGVVCPNGALTSRIEFIKESYKKEVMRVIDMMPKGQHWSSPGGHDLCEYCVRVDDLKLKLEEMEDK